jgi:hypothetical protein
MRALASLQDYCLNVMLTHTKPQLSKEGVPRVPQTRRKVAVIQSNYIPWKGYFDIIHSVDLFVFYDDVQYTKNDWRNRNLIKTPNGSEWLTIPVGKNERRLICDVRLEDQQWRARHWKAIDLHYRKARYFKRYRDFFEQVYRGTAWESLSVLNQFLIKTIATDFLGIRTELVDSRQFQLGQRKLGRLVELLSTVHATEYLSGPSAKAYIEEEMFEREHITLEYKDYSTYPVYDQLCSPPFIHEVSIVDLLFNVGPDAPWYIWGYRDGLEWESPYALSMSRTLL